MVAVEVAVLGVGLVFAHAGVAHPLVAAFAAAPVAAGQLCKVASAVGRRGTAGDVEGDGGLFALVEGGGALDHDPSARSGKSGCHGLEGGDIYLAMVAASIAAVRLFCVSEKWSCFGLLHSRLAIVAVFVFEREEVVAAGVENGLALRFVVVEGVAGDGSAFEVGGGVKPAVNSSSDERD